METDVTIEICTVPLVTPHLATNRISIHDSFKGGQYALRVDAEVALLLGQLLIKRAKGLGFEIPEEDKF